MNQCQIFQYCDLPSHENMDKCCAMMDEYYGATVGGELILYCHKCMHIADAQWKKNIFYRDHGVHLGQISTPEKMHSILKGYIFNI